MQDERGSLSAAALDLAKCVGVAVSWHERFERASDAAQKASPPALVDEETRANMDIMHTKISDKLFVAEVVQSAPLELLAHTFQMSQRFIEASWITSALQHEDEVGHEDTTEQLDEGQSDEPPLSALSQDQRRKLHQRLSTSVNSYELSFELSRIAKATAAGASKRNKRTTRTSRCGFSRTRRHSDVALSCRNSLAAKANSTGLFRSIQAQSCLFDTNGSAGSSSYVEFMVLPSTSSPRKSDAGGVCVGLATDALAVNKMPGMARDSVGLYASGDVVLDGKHFAAGASAQYTCGDTVGVLAERINQQRGASKVSFFVNGVHVNSTVLQLGPPGIKLYPTASLYHTEKKVSLVCCPSELRFVSEALVSSGRLQCETICGRQVSTGRTNENSKSCSELEESAQEDEALMRSMSDKKQDQALRFRYKPQVYVSRLSTASSVSRESAL